MNADFEKRLQDQRLLEIPRQWREEILRAARPQPVVAPWWLGWLWPCPRAWAGLAAAWGFIFLLHLTTPSDPAADKGGSASWQDFAILQRETEIIAQLSGSEENRPVPLPPPAATKPRSSRRLKQSFG